MVKNYVDVRIKTCVDSGELVGMLDDPDLLGTWEENGILHLYWSEERWTPKTLQRLQDTLQGFEFTVAHVEEQDWNATWSRSIQPIRIGARVFVRQSWNSVSLPSAGIELIIDPKQAFGAGYHASTQLLVEWLEENISGGERVLDLGTGSGILAMVALRLGASSALAIDQDPIAIDCATENASVNGFGRELELRCSGIEDVGPGLFDVILANLDRNTLLRCPDRLKAWLAPGGRALISGLILEDYPDISRALETAGMRIQERREREGWLALQVI
jgi:ribosomal protein L11 methyltransferase